jgi:integrase/recombinase XerD
LTQQQINLLMNQPDIQTDIGKRDKAMLELLYATGLQVTEIICIKISDVNLEAKFITCTTKGHERVIPIGNESANALKNYFITRHNLLKQEQLDILFLNSKGLSISRQGIFKIIKQYGAKAGIDDVTPKIIRQSFAVHMLSNGADIKAVQEMMGHKEVSATQAYLQDSKYKLRDVYANAHPRY